MRDNSISSMLAGRIAAGDFPSAVYLVAEGGRVCFADALGSAVREPSEQPATLETIYDLASLTKPLVTGLLCARRVESGALELDAPAAQYLREFARAGRVVMTVRNLLTHTSGLPPWRPLRQLTDGRLDRVLEMIAAEKLECAPGTRVVYSDLGFITLGLLLERLAGESLAELARREIFAPLELRRTFFNPAAALQTEVAACEIAGNAYERAMCGEQGGGGGWREQTIWGEVHDGNAFFLGGAAGHAGLFSTARETLALARQFLAGRTRLLRPETCALFRTKMTPGLNEARSPAWQLAATPDSTAGAALPPDAFGHLGFTGTSCWIDPNQERVYLLFTNRTHTRTLPFANINGVRRQFHTLAAAALERDAGSRREGEAETRRGGGAET
ncbi:MAG TPA: serine hydrolase domain-containing protein [Pyrinomonadaceae bacterium]|jgi:CubicO group peptidase (beta-lactamase class C family)|nr:serine hydrolase domain-containing protein [Pyrinomonadaceae bacterium]